MQYFTRYKKPLIVGGVTLAALLVLAGGAQAVWTYAKKAPERFLYTSLTHSLNFDGISVETPVGSQTSSASSEGYMKPDGTVRFTGQMTCTADTASYGRLNLKLSVVQVQQEIYMRFDEAKLSGATNSKDTAQRINDFLNGKVAGKWLQIETADGNALALKEYGLAFDVLGAVSTHQSEQQIMAKLQAHQVLTILGRKAVKVDDKPAVQYDLRANSTQYRNFIDDLQPGFKYTDKIIDSIFNGDDTTDVTVVIDAKSGQLLYNEYDIPNACGIMASALDPTASGYDATIRLKNFTKPGDSVPGIEKPASYLTQLDFQRLTSGV